MEIQATGATAPLLLIEWLGVHQQCKRSRNMQGNAVGRLCLTNSKNMVTHKHTHSSPEGKVTSCLAF